MKQLLGRLVCHPAVGPQSSTLSLSLQEAHLHGTACTAGCWHPLFPDHSQVRGGPVVHSIPAGPKLRS